MLARSGIQPCGSLESMPLSIPLSGILAYTCPMPYKWRRFFETQWPWLAGLGALLLVLVGLIWVYQASEPEASVTSIVALPVIEAGGETSPTVDGQATFAAQQTQAALTTQQPTETLTPTPFAGGYPGPLESPSPPPGNGTSPAPFDPYPGPGTSQPFPSNTPYPGPGGSGSTISTPLVETPSPTISGQTATGSPSPTNTSAAPPTQQQPLVLPCNLGEFVADVTFPDDTLVYPGQLMPKAWTVRNGGTCTWTTDYDLIYDSGERMESRREVSIGKTVSPNTFADLVMTFIAPREPGKAQGFWLLRSDQGEEFGMGVTRDQPLWIRVFVREPNPRVAFDMINAVCMARWRGRSGILPCLGDTASSSGSITVLDEPELEDGRVEDEPALWTRPGTVTGAFVSGIYPPYIVQAGDHFVADVGCLATYEECRVNFSVGYLEGGSAAERSLLSFEERYDEKLTRIDIDLSALAGREIQLVLTARNLGRADQAQPIWLVPAVINQP
jgi:hypothetical protein